MSSQVRTYTAKERIICRKITASVPIDAGEIEDVTKAVVASVKELSLIHI